MLGSAGRAGGGRFGGSRPRLGADGDFGSELAGTSRERGPGLLKGAKNSQGPSPSELGASPSMLVVSSASSARSGRCESERTTPSEATSLDELDCARGFVSEIRGITGFTILVYFSEIFFRPDQFFGFQGMPKRCDAG